MTDDYRFINYLTTELAKDRPALAALRRGLGQAPGSVPELLRYVVPFVGVDSTWWYERCVYMIGPLFALHPLNTDVGNMGGHLARLKSSDESANSALERRFTSLLAAHPEELDAHLRRTIAILKSKEVPVNWQQLFGDVLYWNWESGRDRVRRTWAGRFWSFSSTESTDVYEGE